jgi:hypothetical protein
LSESTNLSLLPSASLARWIKQLSWRIVGVAVLVFLAASAHAQTTSAVAGTVHDVTGAVIPGAKVVVTNEDNKARWTTTSNEEGFFKFAAIPPATYSLRISQPDFETWTVTGIVVHPGDSLTVPKIAMKVGKAEVSVVVTAEVAGVTLESPEHSTLITAGDINRLSTVGRDVNELISILPGFTINAGSDVQNEGAGGIYGYQTMGFGSAQVGSWGANGSAPQQGQVNVTADGANVIDPGDMGGQVSNVNMDQVQEVKVQTADFGADQAKGPIVINAVGKSGGVAYHGSLYTYFRNDALNSNDWLGKYYGSARPEFRYFYPGGTFGGPVRIPGRHFNEKKSLVFWAGFEYYGQNKPDSLATSFIPNSAMLGGDLSTGTIAKALNVSPTDLAANCPADWNVSATYNNVGGDCWSPSGSMDQTGATVSGGQLKNIDTATTAISKLWPAINRTPKPVVTAGSTQYASDGINYVKNVMGTHNGLQLHTRVDKSITDTLKLFGIYNLERVNDESPLNNIYYNPGGVVPYPTPLYSYGHAHYLTLDLTKTIGSSITNELMASGVYYSEPEQFADPAKAQTTGTAWDTAGYSKGHLGLKESQLPRVLDYESTGIPSFGFGYVPPGSQFLRKFNWNVTDNLTKVYKTHTFKAGIYVEQTGNNNVTLGSQVNGTMTFMRWDTCYPNETTQGANPPSNKANLGNTVGNFLSGCPLGYQQDNGDPTQNVRFRSFEGYVTDEWKVYSKLTLTLGIRFSHLQPWTDPHGIGMAVWDPSLLTQHVVYPDSAANNTWPGIFWHQRNPEVPLAGVPTRAFFYAPRVGVAYDLHGNGKTVFRGGWGTYYSHDSASIAGGLQTGIGLQTYSNPSNITCTFGQLFTTKYVPCGAYSSNPTSITPFSISAMDPKDDHMPVTYNYNFTIDQQGPWKTTFEVTYIGNQSSSLSTLGNLQNQNVIPLGAEFGPNPVFGQPESGQVFAPNNIPNKSDYRAYPNYQSINVANHIAWANYNALQASWNRQTGSLVYGANYTWSKALGVRGNWDTGYIGDPVNPSHDYGILAYDRPQALNLSYSYQEGKKYNGNPILGQAVNGWEISGVTSIQSGPDLAIVNGGTSFGLGGGVNYTLGTTNIGIPIGGDEWLGSSDYTLQPVVTCDPRSNLKKAQFVNGSCFALPAIGTQGWWNLPDVHGPRFSKSDLSVYKDFIINERQNMQFRVSGFNFLNHPLTSFNNNNLGSLSLSAGDCTTCTYTTPADALKGATITNASTFGSTSFRNGVRLVELGFKYNF